MYLLQVVKGQQDWLVEVARVHVADVDGHDLGVDLEGGAFYCGACGLRQVGVGQHGHGGKTFTKG